jgi:ADP-ribosylglycohydrolase
MPIDQDKRRGALWGQAIGDALGVPAEFKNQTLLLMMYGEEGITSYRDTNRGASQWGAGEWSDDTAQALSIMDAYLEHGDVDPLGCARHFLKWAQEDGRGMGNHTWNVLKSTYFLVEPFEVSREVWERSGRKIAPNGGVMRTAGVAVLRPQDQAWTLQAAKTACKVTHWDPRCVASSVAIAEVIRTLTTFQGSAVRTREEAALRNSIALASKAAPEAAEELVQYAHMSLEDLKLDEGMDGPKYVRPPIGYTWKCMGAGFYALRNAHRGFHEVLNEVFMAGGDVDTNGAVAGAVLGAYWGWSNIPEWMKEGLVGGDLIDEKLSRLP